MARRISETLAKCTNCLSSPGICGCFGDGSSDGSSISLPPVPTPVPTPVGTPVSPAITTVPTPAPSHTGPTRTGSSYTKSDHTESSSLRSTDGSTDASINSRNWMNQHDPLMEYDLSLAHLKYNKFQDLGAQRRRWIENTDEPNCPVSLSTLTFADLRQNLGFPLPRRENIDAIFARQVIELGLPNEFGRDSDGNSSAYSRFESPTGTDFIWNGNIGPGVIVIDEVERSPSSTAPRIAYMTKAIYEYGFPLASLNHVLISTIINRNTRRFLKKMLYAPKNNLTWPTPASTSREFPPLTWKHGTAEYDGLLGTELGKIISCLVLSAYPRGTRRIFRIVTWHFPLCMRFDIEDIPN